ncbi:hypothetical protein GUJ93_ZPchr0001g32285 [Zizania palustris]|uniref:Uncharacterized protein n=1 Tax=Zizania palustris TaxID=103762 RepID=A0A8J5RZD9_ZIZPA|nr:hypothetical protein GUJ93_ZPchr0001g32285 [Zizania palustris]
MSGGNLGVALEAGVVATDPREVGVVGAEKEGGVSSLPEGGRRLVAGLVGSLSRISRDVSIQPLEILMWKICSVRLDDGKGKGKQVVGDTTGGGAEFKKLEDSSQGGKGKQDSNDSTYGGQHKKMGNCHFEMGGPTGVSDCLLEEPEENMREQRMAEGSEKHKGISAYGDNVVSESASEGLCENKGELVDKEEEVVRDAKSDRVQLDERVGEDGAIMGVDQDEGDK